MAKKKKKQKMFSPNPVGAVTSVVAVGAIPNITGSAAVTGIQGNYATGMANVASTYPTQGKLAGAGMVFGGISKLKKKSKKLF